MNNYTRIKKCRVGASENLITVLNLGRQALTGVFPQNPEQEVTVGPLELVWCPDSGLLQLNHTYNSSEMYGDNYGYRSGLNQSMVDHLSNKVRHLERLVPLSPGDVTLVPDFFSAAAYQSVETRKARIVTSIAMFYDLDAPIEFAKQIETILADDGIWHFEQSYMPAMLRTNSYDTICHEHLEYYSLGVVKTILEASGLRLIDVVMNSINGGSFAVTAAKAGNRMVKANQAVIEWLLGQEERMGLNTPRPYREFEERVFRHREDLTRLVRSLNADGKKILGYGASTKGNVVLQFCNLTAKDIPAIAEVNTEKFGRITPGSHIPIISEAEARAQKPDYFLVLPWHFKEGILRREKDYLASGGRFIFPFPEIEIV